MLHGQRARGHDGSTGRRRTSIYCCFSRPGRRYHGKYPFVQTPLMWLFCASRGRNSCEAAGGEGPDLALFRFCRQRILCLQNRNHKAAFVPLWFRECRHKILCLQKRKSAATSPARNHAGRATGPGSPTQSGRQPRAFGRLPFPPATRLPTSCEDGAATTPYLRPWQERDALAVCQAPTRRAEASQFSSHARDSCLGAGSLPYVQ